MFNRIARPRKRTQRLVEPSQQQPKREWSEIKQEFENQMARNGQQVVAASTLDRENIPETNPAVENIAAKKEESNTIVPDTTVLLKTNVVTASPAISDEMKSVKNSVVPPQNVPETAVENVAAKTAKSIAKMKQNENDEKIKAACPAEDIKKKDPRETESFSDYLDRRHQMYVLELKEYYKKKKENNPQTNSAIGNAVGKEGESNTIVPATTIFFKRCYRLFSYP